MSEELSQALSNSLTDNLVSLVSDTAEVGLDAFLDEGVYKDIPLLSTVVGIYKVGKSVNDLFLLKKLDVFIKAMNNQASTPEEREKHKLAILSNSKQRSKEIEYLLIIINRYIDKDKPVLLAKAYLFYLDGKIKWEELTVFAEIIDRLLPGDYELLNNNKSIVIWNNCKSDKALRLSAVGLIEPVMGRIAVNISPDIDDSDSENYQAITGEYRLTSLGKQFMTIIE